MSRLTIIGDTLLDRDIEGTVSRVAPDAPVPVLAEQRQHCRPGGAGLAAALAAGDGHEVTLVTALATDAAGDELRRLLTGIGIHVVDLGLVGSTPEKIRMRAAGQSLMRLDRAAVSACGDLTADASDAIDTADGILVSDYGRGVTGGRLLRSKLERGAHLRPIVWDPHPRGTEPVSGALCATPNEHEAGATMGVGSGGSLVAAARRLLERWPVQSLCVTRGAQGALVLERDQEARTVTTAPTAGDPCGAGDRLASRLTALLAEGVCVDRAAHRAVTAASAFVGAGGATSLLSPRSAESARPVERPVEIASSVEAVAELAHRARSRGEVVVAAGGCFDLLHAGHVSMLRSARQLGDVLIVLLNSDDSVRRLKGPSRPVNAVGDRIAVLSALADVEAVAVFDDDDPRRALEAIRPDVWVKGDEYRSRPVPERDAIQGWGGRVVLVPQLDGRSTSGLMKEITWRTN